MRKFRPTSKRADASAPRRISRPGERVAGTFFRAVTRVSGLRPSLIPAHLRRQLGLIGVDDAELERVLANMRSLSDWPYAWEAEGDRHHAEGDFLRAAASWYVAQRLLLTASPLKRRLYRQMCESYVRAVGTGLEILRVDHDGETIAGYLEVPARTQQPAAGWPLVLMLPGVTATKEELHVFAEPLLARGWAVARIDNPGYGETTGMMRLDSMRNGARVLESLADDPRLDVDRFHLFSMSLGGFCALHSAVDSLAQSVTIIASPIEPHTFLHELPDSNITALMQMSGLTTFDELWEMIRDSSFDPLAPKLSIPLRIFHGGRDRTIPLSEAHKLAERVAGPVAITEWERDHHNCLEHFNDIMALTLEWLDDPHPAIAAYELERAALRISDQRAVSLSSLPDHHPTLSDATPETA